MNNKQNETFKIVRVIQQKVIGSIDPIGESNADERRLENLEVHCEIVSSMVGDLFDMINMNHSHYEGSRIRASEQAVKNLKILASEISDLVSEIE